MTYEEAENLVGEVVFYLRTISTPYTIESGILKQRGEQGPAGETALHIFFPNFGSSFWCSAANVFRTHEEALAEINRMAGFNLKNVVRGDEQDAISILTTILSDYKELIPGGFIPAFPDLEQIIQHAREVIAEAAP